jgi:hypothetical protein
MKQESNITGVRVLKSPAAAKFLQLACLGFLASLGFMPGWERLFGFSGFFGFIGVACLIELIHRARHRTG